MERRVTRDGDTLPLRLHAARRLLFALGDFLFIPVLVALGRLVTCERAHDATATTLTIAGSASLTCYAWPHYVVIFILAPLPLVAVCAWPVFVYRRARALLVYSSPAEHERWLQSRETEHVLGLTDQYAHLPLFLVASYSRRFALFAAWQYVPRFLLVFVLFALSPAAVVHYFPASAAASLSSIAIVQVALYIAIFFGSMVVHFCLGLFRVTSSTHVHLILLGTLTADAFFGLLSASQYRSAFLVDSVLSALLLALQCIAFAALALLALFHRFKSQRALRTWPVTLEKIARWAADDEVRPVFE
jgi:hypothetical protein